MTLPRSLAHCYDALPHLATVSPPAQLIGYVETQRCKFGDAVAPLLEQSDTRVVCVVPRRAQHSATGLSSRDGVVGRDGAIDRARDSVCLCTSDACEWAHDGVCDPPTVCASSTDCTDCTDCGNRAEDVVVRIELVDVSCLRRPLIVLCTADPQPIQGWV